MQVFEILKWKKILADKLKAWYVYQVIFLVGLRFYSYKDKPTSWKGQVILPYFYIIEQLLDSVWGVGTISTEKGHRILQQNSTKSPSSTLNWVTSDPGHTEDPSGDSEQLWASCYFSRKQNEGKLDSPIININNNTYKTVHNTYETKPFDLIFSQMKYSVQFSKIIHIPLWDIVSLVFTTKSKLHRILYRACMFF